MSTDPIWFKPRQGFTEACCAYFGMSFDGGPIQPLQPPKSQPKAAYPSMGELDLQRNPRRHGRGAGTVISKKAMKTGRRLVG